MKWLWRILAGLLVVVLVVGVAAAGFGWWTVRRSWPQTEGTINLAGLQNSVDVLRDERGISQIYADNTADLFFAQGFVHAQDRFWEMDVRRHITSGRLSEMFGESQFETDEFLRTMGWRRVAEQEIPLLSDQSRLILDSYAAGVNAYLTGRSSAEISLEYQVLALQNPDYTIETWDPVDSVAWLKALAWDLRSNMANEIFRALGASQVGPERIEQLFPPYPQDRVGTIVSNADLQQAGLPTGLADLSVDAAALLGPEALAAYQQVAAKSELLAGVMAPSGPGIGSNSWVVSGSLTETGLPMLANDPHLAPAMPSLWYQNGLHCSELTPECNYDVAGWTMAGLPGIFIGHNNQIAWGFTNLGPDVLDLVLEQIDGDSYIVDGLRIPLETREEVIKIAGAQDRTITVRSTGRGPIISDSTADESVVAVGKDAPVPAPGQDPPGTIAPRGDGYAVALRWVALDPTPIFDAIGIVNTAQNWDQFRAGAQLLTVPSQNLIYADREGNIGYQAPGTVPIRSGYNGHWPVPGWESKYDWNGTIPFDQMPRTFNPAQGWITTANEQVAPNGYPWPVQSDRVAYGARAVRINDRIAQVVNNGKMTVAQMGQIQMDNGNELAAFLVPKFSDVTGLSEGAAAAVNLLSSWDYQQPASSAEGAFFNVFYKQLSDRMFNDELEEGAVAANDGDRFWEAIRVLWDAPNDPWWDDVSTTEVEDRDQTITNSLNAAYEELVELQGSNPSKWRWGKLHTLTFTNQTLGTSGIGFVERIFNRGPVETSGGGSIPNATGWKPTEGYEVTWVPSMRQVIDLANLDNSTWVNLTGNSGHAYNKNYGDQIQAWVNGEQYPWPSSREAIEAATTQRLTLAPG